MELFYLCGVTSFILIQLIFYLAKDDKEGLKNILQIIYLVGIVAGCLRGYDTGVIVSLWFLFVLVMARLGSYLIK